MHVNATKSSRATKGVGSIRRNFSAGTAQSLPLLARSSLLMIGTTGGCLRPGDAPMMTAEL
jgi:hypothetical protein